MLYLLLRVAFTVSFQNLLRLSQARTPRPMAAAAVNYLIAGIACTAWAIQANAGAPRPTVVLGLLGGFTYVSSMVLLLPAMWRSGLVLTGSLMQISLMVPVAVAVWRFGETPSLAQLGGIALTMVALPLLSGARAQSAGGDGVQTGQGPSWLPWALFVSTGTSQVVMKEFTATRPAAELAAYCAVLFVSATVFTYAWLWLAKDDGRPSGVALPEGPTAHVYGEWPMGVILGVVNVLQLVCLLLALKQLPAVVVFPVSASAGIIVSVVTSLALWKEKPPAAGWAAIVLAVVAVVLLNRPG